ncbi:FAD-dependent oxidoreductase [Streptomyces rishiriensis]|uniref:2-polyprenyl-6-methoxyphenol hydroxylase-like FAD-dependent oxidoreductase n=1 Tax=Streptomyces rishiriensis TaxID=68264 RepID=A0ABU0NFY8_STRRH|nr:FAD-dependent oxidoreductase [Streptomyces rishiriensis]MDQ0578017.1 2-polyprenyl-6-methoxyphenol hydroxylase-like FAD-dependent oxidoreductase [Streptomyces rishiriensis]
MSTVRTVLVIGGGSAGNAMTILLRRAGMAVDLVEAKEDWNATAGSGITVQGNALRVLHELGVWEQVRASGFPFDSFGVTAQDGTVLQVVEDIRTGGDELPATVGMQRPQLQQILIDAVRASGARVRLGTRAEILSQDAHGVDVRLSDGTTGRYDLVIAADGMGSATRAGIGIEDRPVPTGMAIWRVAAPRPQGLDRTDLTYGGSAFIAGYCPTSEHTLYAYVVEANRDRSSLHPSSYADEMRRLLKGYGGHWPEILPHIDDPSKVNYTWFDRMLVEGSWHRGRVVLIGDAAHCCPPTLAQGAAISLEDALVLAELLTAADVWDGALLQAFHDRRIHRVRAVVEASVQIGQWQLDGAGGADVPGLMSRTLGTLRDLP